jgi:protein phosphatase
VAVAWYARGSYFVGLSNDRLTVYKGRPGGLLWFQPTVAATSQVHTADVASYRLNDLRTGKEEPSLSRAQDYIDSLKDEKARLTPTTTTTTAPPVTVPTP